MANQSDNPLYVAVCGRSVVSMPTYRDVQVASKSQSPHSNAPATRRIGLGVERMRCPAHRSGNITRGISRSPAQGPIFQRGTGLGSRGAPVRPE